MKEYGEIQILSLFPTPVYSTDKISGMDKLEIKDVQECIRDGMAKYDISQNATTSNSYIFNTGKLTKLKEFCEYHIQQYVNKIIRPKHEVVFYITQSWINVGKPNEEHRQHSHPNSFISGCYYIKTVEDDRITFYDSSSPIKKVMRFGTNVHNPWNSDVWSVPVSNNKLLLFPSWFEHGVPINEKATTDRISLSFNVFAKGSFGDESDLTKAFI
tara:strand:- start:622 stop:1263 length:642 start_codon:yes stop_codon:yes gene_type:complete